MTRQLRVERVREGETHLKILCDLTNETLERELANEKLCRLLVATDFTEGDGTRAEAMRLLHTTSRGLQDDSMR